MKYLLLMALATSWTRPSMAHSDEWIFDKVRDSVLVTSLALKELLLKSKLPSYLRGKVMDNGQSCVYVSVRIPPKNPKCFDPDRIDPGFFPECRPTTKKSLVTAKSVAAADLMDTLEETNDNSGESAELFAAAEQLLAGKSTVSSKSEVFKPLLEALTKTHSDDSVACSKQTQK